MQRPSPWLMLVVLLLGILILREPRFDQADDFFLRWLLDHSQGSNAPPVPLTVVEIGSESLMAPSSPGDDPANMHQPSDGGPVSPLEFALFLQSALDFEPSVVAFENILKWRERDKDQEQVFLDQAMRVPKLLLASKLSATPDPDAPWGDVRGFSDVKGKRGDLPAFSGFGRQPSEDLRLISVAGFSNLPAEVGSGIRVPMLFMYRGEVVPSFTLQAIMLWLRITPAEVKVEIGSHILLPGNRRIPISIDGTMLVDPTALNRAHRITMNELLLAAQQREHEGEKAVGFHMRNHIVLARTPANPLSPPDLFAAAIASIQGNQYLRRISPIFDCLILLLVAASATTVFRIERVDVVLYGIAFTAAYALIALTALARWNIWLSGLLPLGAVWILILAAFCFRRPKAAVHDIPPPIA